MLSCPSSFIISGHAIGETTGFGSQCKVVLMMQVQSLEDTLQNVNLQMSQIKSDLRVTQKEKEALKQEVMSLCKQLQNADDKVIFLLRFNFIQ